MRPEAVTGLQIVVNEYGSSITFTNTESSGNDRTLPSATACTVGNAWIPWCTNSQDFPDHHMEVTSGDGTLHAYIWQRDNNVLASTDGFEDPGTPIAGNSGIGQSVLLVVTTNGSLIMSTYND